MGTQLDAFKCPHCGQMMTKGTGPNYTFLNDAPTPMGGTVVMLSCINEACQKPLGPYVIPPPTRLADRS